MPSAGGFGRTATRPSIRPRGAQAPACHAFSPCLIHSRSARDGDFLAFIHGWYRWHRVVDLAGGAVDPPLPLTMGFPVGHWEGDTLVIRTVGLIDATVLDAAGMPHSEQMTLTERLRVLDDGRLEDRLRVEDPDTFTKPWESRAVFPSRCCGASDRRRLP